MERIDICDGTQRLSKLAPKVMVDLSGGRLKYETLVVGNMSVAGLGGQAQHTTARYLFLSTKSKNAPKQTRRRADVQMTSKVVLHVSCTSVVYSGHNHVLILPLQCHLIRTIYFCLSKSSWVTEPTAVACVILNVDMGMLVPSEPRAQWTSLLGVCCGRDCGPIVFMS